MEDYDVVIVGAGPAGGNCAAELAKLRYSVLLVERSKVIGTPNFSTGGTPNETMEVFGLPKKVTDSSWDSILIASKGARAEFLFGKRMGYILNYMKLKQFLAKRAKKNGAEVITGVSANDVVIKNEFVSGVKISGDDGINEVHAKVVVDASGGRSVLSKKLGLLKTDALKESLTIGIEYHMGNVELERKRRMDFYLGYNFAPGGYAWIFPMGLTKAKVGIGVLNPSSLKNKPLGLLEKFVKINSQTANASKLDLHSGSLFANGGIKNHVVNGFVAIGDAAVQINPLVGEGIRHALYSGRFAAEAIDFALQKGRSDKKCLDYYNKLWKGYIGNKWKISYLLQRLFYKITTKESNDALIDKSIRLLATRSPEEIFQIAFNYKFDLSRIVKNSPRMIKLLM